MNFEEFPVFVPMGEDHLCAVVCLPRDTRWRAGHGTAPPRAESGFLFAKGGIGIPIGRTSDQIDRGAVLLTGSNYTRTHRNRMWVRTARALAEAGVPSIRLDYHGVGDSTGRAVFDMESPFDADAVVAGDFLIRATGVSQLTFVATCFGGRTAMAAAARHPRATAATIFPVPLLVRRAPDPKSVRKKLKSRIRKWELGNKLFTAPSVRRVRTTAAAGRKERATPISPRFKKDFTGFLARGEVHFIYGDRSESLPDLQRLLTEVEPHLTEHERARIHVQILDGCAPEGFRTLQDQDLAVQYAVESVIRGPGESFSVAATPRDPVTTLFP